MVAAPGLVPEIARSKQLGAGWGCLGCCPDYTTHKYGFHLPQSRLSDPGDYSLSGAKNRPVGDYCCALDISTTTPRGRRYVASMFARWDAGQQPVDQAEFIGSPDGRRVLYASWKKPGVVETYRGTGHDHWCHSSKFRSLARLDGRWFDPDGPFMPGGGDGGALVAVTDAQWRDLVADVNSLNEKVERLNKQCNRLDDIISGEGRAYPGSNLAEQFTALNSRLDALTAAVQAARPAGP